MARHQQRIACMMMINMIMIIMIMILLTSVDARVYHDFLPKKNDRNNYDIYKIFKEFGYDDDKLEYHRRRFMQMENQTSDRVAPGGPAAQHHK